MQHDISTIVASRGFFLYRKFLTSEETSTISNTYSALSISENKNYPVKVLDLQQMPKSVYNKLSIIKNKCFPNIQSEITNAAFFSVNTSDLSNSINSGFHQDHESYYFTGDHTHHLNLYLTIKKDDPKNSNLKLIPADSLYKIDRKFYEISIGSGASMIVNDTYFSQSNDLAYKFNFDLDAIIETPELNVGDLLIMRGDIIHGTQNQDSNRVALSVRTGRTDVIVNKNRYYPTSLNHLHFIKNNIKPYAKRAFLFMYSELDFMSLQELHDLYIQVGNNYTAEIKNLYEKFLIEYIKFLELYLINENEKHLSLSSLAKNRLINKNE